MNEVNKIIVVTVVSILVMVVTYVIQFYSKISPCNIEFDGKKKKEIELMMDYNKLFDKIFYGAGVVIMFLGMATLICFINFAAILVVLELIYFVANIVAMMLMYIRSILYWKIREAKENMMNTYGVTQKYEI